MILVDLIWELRALVAVIVLSLLAPNTGRAVARALARPFRKLATHRRLSIVFVGLLSLTITTTVGILAGWPKPYIHDEFAYALTADTFAHGRVTNPTHPMSDHFETYHILQKPSYQAKYPPAQGLVLALGQVLAGRQIVGVWLSVAAGCAAVCWMLQGWLPPRWALFGGVLAAVHPTVIIWWGENYWGGAVAMIGGALLYGALPRIRKHLRVRDAVVCGLGLVILANSRPYEGLAVSIPAAVVLLVWLVRDRNSSLSARAARSVIPITVTLAIGACGTGYYNYRVTGNALRLPYREWLTQYFPQASMSTVLWKNAKTTPVDEGVTEAPSGFHPKFELWCLPAGSQSSDLSGGWRSPGLYEKIAKHHIYFFRAAFALTIFAVPLLLGRRDVRLAVVAYAAVASAVLLNACAGHAHYYAPGTALLILLFVQGTRRLRIAKIGRLRWGLTVAMSLLPLTVGASWYFVEGWMKSPVPPGYEWVNERERITEQLIAAGGRHLVLVQYRHGHDISLEWVYNEADLDNSAILWARPISPERTQELAAYFDDRTVWLLDADAVSPQLTAYRGGASPKGEGILDEKVPSDQSMGPFETEVTSLLTTGGEP